VSKQALNHRKINAPAALVAASKHVLFHYPTMYTVRRPRRLVLADAELWIAPIVLTHPDHGVVGDVGFVAIDAGTGAILGSTPRREVVRAGKQLREAKSYGREAAVFPARAV
jgi:hypothetical protein